MLNCEVVELKVLYIFSHSSGEVGFKKLIHPYAWAKFPMVHRIMDLDAKVKVTMLLGEKSWIRRRIVAEEIENPGNFEVYTIRDAGHHVNSDEPAQFNERVKHVFKSVDEEDLIIALKLRAAVM